MFKYNNRIRRFLTETKLWNLRSFHWQKAYQAYPIIHEYYIIEMDINENQKICNEVKKNKIRL
jgi:hypothetical protein